MVIRSVFFIILCWGQNLNALGSLMFHPKECQRIECQRHQKNLDDMIKSGRGVKCDGILYHSPSDWAFWMNGQCVSSKDPESLKGWAVHHVTAHEVRGTLSIGNAIYPLTLKPGESFFAQG